MKIIRILLNFAAILLVLTSAFSCGKEKNETTEIPFTEYSLINTNCWWTNFDYFNKVLIINNKSELETHVTCAEGTFPEIDFAKHTLLLAYGRSTQNVGSINIALFKHSITEYELKVTVFMGDFMVAEGWHISIIVPKILGVAKINLKADLIKP
jgi:hypothetical protein